MASSSTNPLSNLHLAAIDEQRARHAKIDRAHEDTAKARLQLGFYNHLEATMAETFGADIFDGNTAPKAGSKRDRQALEADEDVSATTTSAPPPPRRSTRVAAAACAAPAPSAPIGPTNTSPGADHTQQTGMQEGAAPSQESSGDKPTREEYTAQADTTQKAVPQDSDAPQTECANENPACTPFFPPCFSTIYSFLLLGFTRLEAPPTTFVYLRMIGTTSLISIRCCTTSEAATRFQPMALFGVFPACAHVRLG
ncbi:hypothetical protein DFH06DRAFT_1322574 [Mycena polygramma]|nr:hypothetical protein DFH06DRAFT_1322574 [Mycena polygramma]